MLPAVAGLKKQGANDGASMAFLIATPETGADSIAVTYALLDPIMTVFRPVAAFFTAILAGVSQNFLGGSSSAAKAKIEPDLACRVDHCCDGKDCPPEIHRRHHTIVEKIRACLSYGFGEILDDIAKWLVLGVVIAGVISVMVPDSFMQTYLGGGIQSMLVMLAVGIPFYICATASTPIAAALILKGISPGAALVFLLAGPATNAATISVVYGLFRKRATVIYLASIAVSAIGMGLLLDQVYNWLQIPAVSVAGEAGESHHHWAGNLMAVVLLFLMVRSLAKRWIRTRKGEPTCCASGQCTSLGHIDGADVGCSHAHGAEPPMAGSIENNCTCGGDQKP